MKILKACQQIKGLKIITPITGILLFIGAVGYFAFVHTPTSGLPLELEAQDMEKDTPQFFPIGLICVDDYSPRDPKDPPSKMTVLEEFPEIAKAGFNLLHTIRFDVASAEWGNTDENARVFLDAAHKHGMKVLMGVSYADWPEGKTLPNDQLNLLLKRVRALKDHPALFGWVIGDDTPQGGWGEEGGPLEPSPEKLQKIRQAIKQVDAAHPLVVSLPGAVDQNYEYRDIADIYMLDNLPVGFEVIPPGIPSEWEAHPEDVGKFVDIVRKVIGPKQKVQAHVQIYNLATDPLTWENEQGRMPRELGRYPTRAEMRFLAYNALIHKSYGVGFNCYRYDYTNYGRDDADGREGRDDISPRGNPSQWRAVASVATELKSMAPIFLAPDANKKITVKPETAGIEFLLKDYENKLYLIAANPSIEENRVTFTLPQPVTTAIKVLNESRSITPKDGSFTDSFDGYGVHVYEITTAFGDTAESSADKPLAPSDRGQVGMYKPSNAETQPAPTSTPEFAPTLTPLSSAGGTMGMRIEEVTEENGAVAVLTTGAKFLIERDGAVTFWQRISRERKVLEARLPQPTSPFRVEREGDFAVKISYESASLAIHADSVAILKLNADFRTTFQTSITPSYNVENKGRRLLIDAEGGFGIYPVSTSTPNSIDSSWRITYSFSRGEEVWLSILPPRPYNRQRSFESIAHEGNEWEPYPNNEVIQSDGRYNKVFTLHAYFWAPAQINVRSAPSKTAGLRGTQPTGARGTIIDGPVEEYSDTIWWQVRYDKGLIGWTIEEFFTPLDRPFSIGDRIQTIAASPWRATRHVPSNMDEFRRVRDEVHRNGMRFVLYVSPFYSEAPDIFAELERILREYQVDGFYFDGIADNFWDSYHIIRQAREMVGGNRILYVHDSLSPDYNGLVYFPFVDTYADYILRGEGGRLGLGLQEFLHWTISGYNISNAVGYWVYYGSNIDDLSKAPPGCAQDGNQICYQTDVVPTTAHINVSLRNEARIWRMAQSWAENEEELRRFDREYYGELNRIQSRH